MAKTAPDAPLTAAAASPCEVVAAAARRVPAARWVLEEVALEPTLHIEKAWADSVPRVTPPDPLEAKLAALPDVISPIGASKWAATFIEHVPGTDLYEAYTRQGTLLEQSAVFIRARSDAPPKVLTAPRSASGGEWTTSEDLGEVNGRPFIIKHGRNESTALDQDIQLTPWLGSQWGPACRVALRFLSDYKVTERFCGDAEVCALAANIAGQVARKFDTATWSDEKMSWSEGEFAFGPAGSAEAHATALRVAAGGLPLEPDFSKFGIYDNVPYPWSSNDFTPFPLVLNGRSYLAIIGHEGVGWRSGTKILIAIYDPHGEEPKALAGIVVQRSIAALDRAEVHPAKLNRRS